jgi:hypothetical protein
VIHLETNHRYQDKIPLCLKGIKRPRICNNMIVKIIKKRKEKSRLHKDVETLKSSGLINN